MCLHDFGFSRLPHPVDLHKQIANPTHVPTSCGSPAYGQPPHGGHARSLDQRKRSSRTARPAVTNPRISPLTARRQRHAGHPNAPAGQQHNGNRRPRKIAGGDYPCPLDERPPHITSPTYQVRNPGATPECRSSRSISRVTNELPALQGAARIKVQDRPIVQLELQPNEAQLANFPPYRVWEILADHCNATWLRGRM